MIVSLFVSVSRRIRAMTLRHRREPHKIRLVKTSQVSFIVSGGKTVFKIIQ